MIKASEHLPDDVATLKAALIETRTKLSGAEALIAHLQLVIKKMKREAFGPRSERSQRLLDQMELQLEELDAAAGEDATKAATKSTTQVYGFKRQKANRGCSPTTCRAGASCILHPHPAHAAAAPSSPRSA